MTDAEDLTRKANNIPTPNVMENPIALCIQREAVLSTHFFFLHTLVPFGFHYRQAIRHASVVAVCDN